MDPAVPLLGQLFREPGTSTRVLSRCARCRETSRDLDQEGESSGTDLGAAPGEELDQGLVELLRVADVAPVGRVVEHDELTALDGLVGALAGALERYDAVAVSVNDQRRDADRPRRTRRGPPRVPCASHLLPPRRTARRSGGPAGSRRQRRGPSSRQPCQLQGSRCRQRSPGSCPPRANLHAVPPSRPSEAGLPPGYRVPRSEEPAGGPIGHHTGTCSRCRDEPGRPA